MKSPDRVTFDLHVHFAYDEATRSESASTYSRSLSVEDYEKLRARAIEWDIPIVDALIRIIEEA